MLLISDHSDVEPFTTSTSKTPDSLKPPQSNLAADINFGLGRFNHYQNLNELGEIRRPVDEFPLISTGNLISDGLDGTSFDPNDADDSIYNFYD